jgi:diacylglycerol kinase family enzyme
MKIGILCNPLSGKIIKSKALIDSLRHHVSTEIYQESSTKEEILNSIDNFNSNGIELIIIAAGDGTVQLSLGHILENWNNDKLPSLFILPAGTTNMTAYDLGVRGSIKRNVKNLKRYLDNGLGVTSIKRHVLCIEQENKQSVYGMFFGVGMIVNGVKYFHEHIKGTGLTGEKASSLVVMRYVFDLLIGNKNKGVNSSRMSVTINNEQEISENITIAFATTLNRLLLGMRPYWDDNPGPIHTTLVTSAHKRIWRTLVPILTGNGKNVSENDGYYSKNTELLTLKMDGDYIVDGELFSSSSTDGPLKISARGPVDFLYIDYGK